MPVDSPRLALGAKEQIFLSKARKFEAHWGSSDAKTVCAVLISLSVLIGIWALSEGKLGVASNLLTVIAIMTWQWDKARDAGKLIRIIDRQAAKIRTLNEG